jgi:hypothetical protein
VWGAGGRAARRREGAPPRDLGRLAEGRGRRRGGRFSAPDRRQARRIAGRPGAVLPGAVLPGAVRDRLAGRRGHARPAGRPDAGRHHAGRPGGRAPAAVERPEEFAGRVPRAPPAGSARRSAARAAATPAAGGDRRCLARAGRPAAAAARGAPDRPHGRGRRAAVRPLSAARPRRPAPNHVLHRWAPAAVPRPRAERRLPRPQSWEGSAPGGRPAAPSGRRRPQRPAAGPAPVRRRRRCRRRGQPPPPRRSRRVP